MAATWMPALALVFGLVGLAPGARAQDCPASQPATERAACLVQAMAEAEAALEVARVDATKA
ncbi:hypothetical protein ABTE31_20265, partial [Acinetobacter baumannii]